MAAAISEVPFLASERLQNKEDEEIEEDQLNLDSIVIRDRMWTEFAVRLRSNRWNIVLRRRKSDSRQREHHACF